MNTNYKHSDLTDKIIRAFYNVYNKLGYGLLEKVYENAMMIELPKFGLDCKNQYQIKVYYDEKSIGDYFADIIVNNMVIIELKSAENLCEEHETQLVNYLIATNIEVGILLNFGKGPQFKRKVFSSEFKNLNKS
ncbi:MAG: GxxExxY protein [Ignavibacteriaceae bacterium]|nr:GxxExxY protein [Ignavibacteriaceae bacterium]